MDEPCGCLPAQPRLRDETWARQLPPVNDSLGLRPTHTRTRSMLCQPMGVETAANPAMQEATPVISRVGWAEPVGQPEIFHAPVLSRHASWFDERALPSCLASILKRRQFGGSFLSI